MTTAYEAAGTSVSMRSIIRCARVRLEERLKDEAHRFYIAECLRSISENTAKTASGSYMKVGYINYMTMIRKPPDKRTGEEIALDVIMRAGLKLE